MAFDMSLVIKRGGPTPPYKLVYQRGPNRFQASVIMTISTYTTGASRAEMTRQLGSCAVKKRVLAHFMLHAIKDCE